MGVIHRDISPDSLILRRRDELPVLIDFGCIKKIEFKIQSELSAIASFSIPSIATALGKAGYCPSEQVERGIVYAHSDLYALAATSVVLLARYMLEARQQRKAVVFYSSTSNYSQSLKSEFTTAVALGGAEK